MHSASKSLVILMILVLCTACNYGPAKSAETAEATATPRLPTAPPTTPFPATDKPNDTPTAAPTFSSTPFEVDISLDRLVDAPPLAITGSIAFYADNGQMSIAEIRNPTAPQELWHKDIGSGHISCIVVANSRAFAVTEDNIQIWDITNPKNPGLMGLIPVADQTTIVSPHDQLLYLIEVVDHEHRNVSTIDVTHPAEPLSLGAAVLELAVPRQLVITDRKLFYLYDERVEVLDISDPTAAIPLATLTVPTNISSQLQVIGDHLYIGTNSGLWLFDISDPRSPQEVSYFPDQVDQMIIADSRGYLLASICGWEIGDDGQPTGGCGILLEVVDFTLPDRPKMLGYARLHTETNQEYVEEVRFLGDFVFLRTNSGQWYVFDSAMLKP